MNPLTETCPFCGMNLKWKISGTGKHYGGYCTEHGFLKIVRNPLWNQVKQPKQGFLTRAVSYLFGEK